MAQFGTKSHRTASPFPMTCRTMQTRRVRTILKLCEGWADKKKLCWQAEKFQIILPAGMKPSDFETPLEIIEQGGL